MASLTETGGNHSRTDFAIPRRYARYEDLLADPDVDAVYMSVIHPLHAQWAIAAATARKHVLVEKPIGMSLAEAEAMIEAARRNDVFLMEAFMYRCHPQMARLAGLIHDGAIGEVLAIRSTFSFSMPFDESPGSSTGSSAAGPSSTSGATRLPCRGSLPGRRSGKPFADPVRVKASGVIGRSGVDTYTAATVEFPRGIIAELACGIPARCPSRRSSSARKGRLSLPNPWLPSSPARTALKPLPRTPLAVGEDPSLDPRPARTEGDRVDGGP